ncbi:MAG: V-type ATP synthase subunit F [Eubacteriales bacterium]|nr:V-type ATP synthase subunit F [Eubacteriales bacterium]
MYKIGIIGDRESVSGFKAVGIDVFTCDSGEAASKALRDMADDGYAIIYITEDLSEKIEDDIDKYKDVMLPAVIPIPGKGGPSGNGLRNVSKAVERAVGSDILFGGGK